MHSSHRCYFDQRRWLVVAAIALSRGGRHDRLVVELAPLRRLNIRGGELHN